MTEQPVLSRRILLGAPMLLSMAGGTAACAQSGETASSGAATLVACFSRSGNTRVIAGQIQRALRADLFDIQPAQLYPEDYEATVEQARRERDRGYAPPLARTIERLDDYETVFLGFPIWGGTTPPVIRAFLRAHAMTGKVLRPFITHGGYGLGDSQAVLAAHTPGAWIEPAFFMEADQERRTLDQVTGWLGRAAQSPDK